MHKADLIQKLQLFAAAAEHAPNRGWKGQETFAEYFAHYLEGLSIPSDEKYDFFHIEQHLPELLVAAFENLRTGTDEETIYHRKMYEKETGHEVPHITDLGVTHPSERGSAVQTTLGFLMKDVTGLDWIEQKIDAYCNAQSYVLQQMFDRFLREVYWRGMYDLIDQSSSAGVGGKFGTVELRTFVTAGRIMITFARKLDPTKPSLYEKEGTTYSNEHSVSFVAEDGDPLALGAGMQSIHTDFRTALDLIEEVIKHWPEDQAERAQVFGADEKISIL